MIEFQGQVIKLDGNNVTIRVDDQLLIDTLHSTELLPSVALGLVDERQVTPAQRRKAHALLDDMRKHFGYYPQEMKEAMKAVFYAETGNAPFSFENTDVTTARTFISFLIEMALKYGVPLKQPATELVDDLELYMTQSMRYRACAVCGKHQSDIHHIDAIGMGNDRLTADHRGRRMVCLCWIHHNQAHNMGWATFSETFHLVGVVPPDDLIKQLGLMTQKRMNEIDS